MKPTTNSYQVFSTTTACMCNHCTTTYNVSGNKADLMHNIRQDGWTADKDGNVYCLECKPFANTKGK